MDIKIILNQIFFTNRQHLVAYTFFLFFALSQSSTWAQKQILITNSQHLQKFFAQPLNSVEVILEPGVYHLTATSFVDSTCGNCENPSEQVPATFGLRIRGSRIKITGPEKRTAVIYTHAGYGLYFEDCQDCLIENVTITGGQRDPDGRATDAAIVVKNSVVTIQNTRIINNLGDSLLVVKNVVGIMGICGREGSKMKILHNEIIRNSWDGIALYRDAEAIIKNNLIDGVDKARGAQVGGGRGVGIGLTWNSKAEVRNNLVRRYWKGIGIFVDAEATVEGNIIEDILTWGIALWDADKGKPVGRIRKNVIYKTGACGASITRSASGKQPGYFSFNVLVQTAQNPRYDDPDYYCFQCALALHAVPKNFQIANNLFFNNRRATTDLPDYDMPEKEFVKALQPLLHEIKQNSLMSKSEFLKDLPLNHED